jgi:hypothetical protein
LEKLLQAEMTGGKSKIVRQRTRQKYDQRLPRAYFCESFIVTEEQIKAKELDGLRNGRKDNLFPFGIPQGGDAGGTDFGDVGHRRRPVNW